MDLNCREVEKILIRQRNLWCVAWARAGITLELRISSCMWELCAIFTSLSVFRENARVSTLTGVVWELRAAETPIPAKGAPWMLPGWTGLGAAWAVEGVPAHGTGMALRPH